MPSLVTHCLYADKTILKSTSDSLTKIIRRNKQAFYIGCQGPDLFLFYHKLPIFKSGKEINQLGTELHRLHTPELFSTMFEKAREKMDETLIAFSTGFACHHCLDSQAHPYVYYRTGSLNRVIPFRHVNFEAHIEGETLKQNHLQPKDYCCYKLISCSKKVKEKISSFLASILAGIGYSRLTEKIVSACISEMQVIERFLYDNNGKKYAFIEKLEKKLNREGLGTSMMIPTFPYDNEWDVMNYRHNSWCNPTDDSERSNASFDELAQKAIELGITFFENFQDYLDDRVGLDQLMEFFGDRNFETNRHPNFKMKYFEADL